MRVIASLEAMRLMVAQSRDADRECATDALAIARQIWPGLEPVGQVARIAELAGLPPTRPPDAPPPPPPPKSRKVLRGKKVRK